jgi:4-hydroxybenzoate polyprenyltransferase
MSSIDLIAGYLVERARPSVFIPLAMLIAASAWVAAPGTPPSGTDFALCATEALLLVLALRVWDDLQDRARDAARHPDRVTVRARRVGPLVALAVLLAVCGALLLGTATSPAARIAIVGSIGLGLLVWYRVRPTEPSRLSGIVLLAKYPALAIALAPGLGELTPMRAAAAAGLLYLIVGTYEYLEDRPRGIS